VIIGKLYGMLFEYGVLVANEAGDFDGLIGFQYVTYGPTVLLL